MTEVTKIDQSAQQAAPQGAAPADPMVSMIERIAMQPDLPDDGRAAAGNTIDADQYRELRELIDKAGVAQDVVCQAAGVTMLELLPAKQFEAVKKRLHVTIQKKGQDNA